jgi:hypothetical protein
VHRLLLVAAVLACLGCRGVVGPFASRQPQRVDDPGIPISEQERRGRDRLALPDPDTVSLPRTYNEFPGPHGR